MTATVINPMSPRQIAFLKVLTTERDWESNETLRANVMVARATWRQLTKRQASELIGQLSAAPRKLTPAPAARALEAGLYLEPSGRLVKVYLGQKSGQLLAKVAIVEPGNVDFQYLGSAARHLAEGAERLTVEQVGQLGVTSGTCMMCGRRLDDPESVQRGIGPVCASKY